MGRHNQMMQVMCVRALPGHHTLKPFIPPPTPLQLSHKPPIPPSMESHLGLAEQERKSVTTISIPGLWTTWWRARCHQVIRTLASFMRRRHCSSITHPNTGWKGSPGGNNEGALLIAHWNTRHSFYTVLCLVSHSDSLLLIGELAEAALWDICGCPHAHI